MCKKNKNIPNEELRFALYYILKHKTGYTDALNMINESMSEYLSEAGFISLGVDAAAHGRYHTTQKGAQDAEVLYIAMCTPEINQ